MIKARQSNIELFRIISMMMILLVHADGASLGMPSLFQPWVADGDFGTWSKELVETFAIIGVNCFVLISGYFGIRLTGKRLINYILWCAFYSIVIYVAVCIVNPKLLVWENAKNALLVFSGTDLWFIRDYLFLMLISPLLNLGVESMSRKQFQLLIVGILVIDCYFGWFCEGSVDKNGYNIVHLSVMYLLARYVSFYWRQVAVDEPKNVRRLSIIIYIFCFLSILGLTMVLPYVKVFSYNSPLVIAASVAFFMIFITLRFQSSTVNWIASSSFAVYLIHKNPYIFGGLFVPLFKNLSAAHGYLMFTLLCIVALITIFMDCVLIDRVRKLITDPIVKFLCRIFHFA
ncbi:MAG: acyltransferase [Muribaculaceae bacterium]|jgi:hypothetical protein|nr:acyltransferase [Muribaculaceae bacterium]